jgi:gamma-glutamylcyclotransferase (GGCT)/AIG2-like uncharacterized protein YtfP
VLLRKSPLEKYLSLKGEKMSCRSTSISHYATAETKFLVRNLDDSQVSSLYHALKREAKNEETSEQPTLEEYNDFLEQKQWAIRNDESLTYTEKERLISRLNKAKTENIPNPETWFASKNILTSAIIAENRISNTLEHVSKKMNVSEKELTEVFDSWRKDPEEYEDPKDILEKKYRYDMIPGMPTDARTSKALRKLGYEHFLSEPYPVFVYGTLRSGQHNFGLMGKAPTEIRDAKLYGVAVYGSSRAFPYAANHPDPNAVTVGEIVWLSPDEEGENARLNLDYLEGFDSDSPSTSHYTREKKIIVTENEMGEQERYEAWVYIAHEGISQNFDEQDRISHGDWVQAKKDKLHKHYSS